MKNVDDKIITVENNIKKDIYKTLIIYNDIFDNISYRFIQNIWNNINNTMHLINAEMRNYVEDSK